MASKTVLEAQLTCPQCGFVAKEVMPADACQFFYQCRSCKQILRPLNDDCCVYCSYANVPCPPVQAERSCC